MTPEAVQSLLMIGGTLLLIIAALLAIGLPHSAPVPPVPPMPEQTKAEHEASGAWWNHCEGDDDGIRMLK